MSNINQCPQVISCDYCQGHCLGIFGMSPAYVGSILPRLFVTILLFIQMLCLLLLNMEIVDKTTPKAVQVDQLHLYYVQ